MLRCLLFSSILFVIGFYTSQYDLFNKIALVLGGSNKTEPIISLYKNGTTKRGTPCLIVRPEDNREFKINIEEDNKIYTDFTSNNLNFDGGDFNPNSTQVYCYMLVDTEEYKLWFASKRAYPTSKGIPIYHEIYKFVARNSIKYKTKNENYQIQRICEKLDDDSINVRCYMTHWLSEESQYQKDQMNGKQEVDHTKFCLIILACCSFALLIVGLLSVAFQ